MIRKPAPIRFVTTALAAALLTAGFAFTASGAVAPEMRAFEQVALLSGSLPSPTPAQTMFPDAPDGVDPVVTGPVSSEFRARQQQLGCKQATWPEIATGCYPD